MRSQAHPAHTHTHLQGVAELAVDLLLLVAKLRRARSNRIIQFAHTDQANHTRSTARASAFTSHHTHVHALTRAFLPYRTAPSRSRGAIACEMSGFALTVCARVLRERRRTQITQIARYKTVSQHTRACNDIKHYNAPRSLTEKVLSRHARHDGARRIVDCHKQIKTQQHRKRAYVVCRAARHDAPPVRTEPITSSTITYARQACANTTRSAYTLATTRHTQHDAHARSHTETENVAAGRHRQLPRSPTHRNKTT
jgi:hypothetical protein